MDPSVHITPNQTKSVKQSDFHDEQLFPDSITCEM